MSTRIGWAFVVGITDATELARLVDDFRERLEPIRRRDHARLLAQRTTLSIDRHVAQGKEWPRSPLSKAYRAIDEAGRESDVTQRRAVFEDFGFEISLIPDAETRSTYGMLHAERTDWKRLWMRQEGIREFGYQNASDRPDGITAAEWRLRERTWDRIMPTGVPARHGFSARLFGTRIDWPRTDALRFQPSLASRKLHIAKDIHIGRRMEEAGVGPEMDFGVIMRAAARANTPDGRKEVEDIASTLLLPRRITRELAGAEEAPARECMDLA